jgi:hypothetical protein
MNSTWTRVCLLTVLLAGPGASFSQAGDERKKEISVEAFRIAIKDVRSIDEKADLIRLLGGAEAVDTGAVVEISRFLTCSPADINFQLPLAAASALANLRGNKAASQNLIQALALYKKTLFVQKRLLTALGQVGHESAVPALEDLIKGTDGDLAVLAIGAMSDLPADLALDSLFRTTDWIAARRPKVGDDVKKVYDRITGEILKVTQQISAEKYPSMAEMQRWWQKHSREWKEIAASRERDREKQKPAAAVEAVPGPIVEFLFSEKGGVASGNGGSSSGLFPFASLTKSRPVWSTEAPPPGAGSALDWGMDGGPYAVDLTGPLEHLKNLKSFSVTGWINARSASEGAGGNRIVSWLDREGVEIVHRADGSLQVGINQKADGSDARTPSAQIPLVDEKVDHSIPYNWRFFAVTYDSTVASGQLKIYIGTRDIDVKLSVQRDSPGGKVGSKISAGLSIGNVPASQRQAVPKCNFRGLIDEVRVFGSGRDGAGALSLPALIKVQGRT